MDLVEGGAADRAGGRGARFSTHTTRHLCLTDLTRMGWELHAIAGIVLQHCADSGQAYWAWTGGD